jgi:hypothetical protein
MKRELADFGVWEDKISVIPFGINDTVPITAQRERGTQTTQAGGSHPSLLWQHRSLQGLGVPG